MRKFILLAALCCSVPLFAQSVPGTGDPTSLSPVPSCVLNTSYVDKSTGNLWLPQGSPCVWVNASGINVELFDVTTLTPAAATTYYVGMGGAWAASGVTVIGWMAGRSCTIIGAKINMDVTGTKDTGANAFTFKIYDVTTATAFADTAVTLTAQTLAPSTSVTGTSDAVASGDVLAIQVTTPASYTTPPTGVYFSANLTCK